MFEQSSATYNIDSIKINFDTELLWVMYAALAIVMFGVSLGIKTSDFTRLFKQPKILIIGVLSQFVLFPLISFLLVLLVQPHPSFALGMLLVASCPGGNISNFYSKMGNGNAALSISLTVFASLVSVFMTPLNLSIWAGMYPPTNAILKTVSLDFWELFKVVALILFLPLVAGMYINKTKPNLSVKFIKFIKPFSLIFLVILIFFAISDNLFVFKHYIHLIALLVLMQNFSGYIIGFFTSKLTKLDEKDARTIAIETGIQNSGLGLVLVFSFFEGMGGLALIVAFWGVWDMVSGLMLATYWSRKQLGVSN